MAFYKRSTFLIDPGFQLRFSAAVCLLVVLSSLIYPLLLWDFFNEIIALQPALKGKLTNAKNDFMVFLITIQVIFSGVIFILFIFLTHKIAGPLFKLKKHLSNIRHGDPISPLTFRNGDHFTDVAEEVSLFLDTVSRNQENDFQYIEEVSSFIENLTNVVPDDKKPLLNEISRRLMEIQSRYKKPL